MSEVISGTQAVSKVFRWLHFGSCLFKEAFKTPEFRSKTFAGLPIQVSQIWRRDVAAVMNDWTVAADLLEDMEPSAFSQSWLSSPAVFQQADVILVDLILDIFHPDCLRLNRPDDVSGVSYDRIVCNFPDEPPAGILDRVRAFPCNEKDSIAAWEKFGRTIQTPVVFVTYENREDIPRGYGDLMRNRLRNYQDAISELAKQFPHWLVISMDDLFAEHGRECYVDRHHPTQFGWQVLRDGVFRIIEESDLISENPGGTPLPIREWNIPERCDFGVLDQEYFEMLAQLAGRHCAIGPARLTTTARSFFGPQLETYEAFSQLNDKASPETIIILKWSQPSNLQPWLAGLIKKHPETIFEIPTLWRGRENNMISVEEQKLRASLKEFSNAHQTGKIRIPELSPFLHRYLSRCLMRSHRVDIESGQFQPVSATKLSDSTVEFPQELIDTLATFNPIAVFSAHN